MSDSEKVKYAPGGPQIDRTYPKSFSTVKRRYGLPVAI
jgi:hypothetical protein